MPRQKGNGSVAWRDPAGITSTSPEQRLLAALIRLTVHDARAGDAEAVARLLSDARGWLAYITPEHCDPPDIHETLLRIAGCRVSVPST